MKAHLLALTIALAVIVSTASSPDYSIQEIRFADSPGDRVSDMVMGASNGESINTIYAVWLIRGGGRNILFDSGFQLSN